MNHESLNTLIDHISYSDILTKYQLVKCKYQDQTSPSPHPFHPTTSHPKKPGPKLQGPNFLNVGNSN